MYEIFRLDIHVSKQSQLSYCLKRSVFELGYSFITMFQFTNLTHLFVTEESLNLPNHLLEKLTFLKLH